MSKNYFADLKNKSEGRFWINNPSKEEVQKSIDQGAIACTTNPAYCSKLLKSEPEYITGVIDSVVRKESDIEKAAVLVYQETSKRLMEFFKPLYEKSNGTEGFVTMQDDPRIDEETETVVKMAMEHRKLGPNYMAKIPVIKGGIEAIETCVAENLPICATEVFAVSQAVYMCEAYEAAVSKTGNRPPIYVTHITGIFDEYLEKFVKREGIDISPDVLSQAGLAVARKEYRVLKEKGFNVVMLGGGARRMEHFTGIMGGDAHVTINWSTADEILKSDIELENNMTKETDGSVIAELREKLPDFAKAYDDDGLSLAEFNGYGPVQLFRNAFLKGWYLLLAEVANRKTVHAL